MFDLMHDRLSVRPYQFGWGDVLRVTIHRGDNVRIIAGIEAQVKEENACQKEG